MEKSQEKISQNDPNSSQKYVPRIKIQTQDETKSYYNRFKDYFEAKLKYKSFRMKMLTEFQERKGTKDGLNLRTLDALGPFMIFNSFLITAVMSRKQGPFIALSKGVAIGCFTYFCVVFYGEERVFHENCMRDDVVGQYLRSRYLKEMEGHIYTDLYRKMNQEIMNQYYIMPKDQKDRLMDELKKS